MSLHPSILFHFTCKENFKKILIDDFRPSYARERFDGSSPFKFGVPMVSFMDIKLSELKIHYNDNEDPKFKYGNYGIGITKNWAKGNGICPVFYNNPNTGILNDFANECIRLTEDVAKSDNVFDKISHRNVTSMLCYMKNYQGLLERRNKPKVENYMFADEKEW